ncbi:AAA family ATPase [Photobacterium phosphoreum]|uniref:AAA family ATPase n=1 Tax=Photobacterium phosphoreum TaxID=659 RepID=A0AAW4ZLA9_PHOPO|nr:AAA family ATPase [Photobacterium phosphoreum]MCD9489864.1 AAA family ATPase [Photobacterium phosphoreum]MCF2189130.1 AAA family ATPase [Photobacterium phosphoreum]MCF2301155.1 AAA family ATPase [Photobacterium phosphoreum]
MDISIRNFGTISQADVKIGGLTVIAGENDTGKSTVGKILFSLVKASARYEEDLKEDKEYKIVSLAEKIYFTIRRNVNLNDYPLLREQYHPRKFFDNIRIYQESAIYERKLSILDLFENKKISSQIYGYIDNVLDEIREVFNEDDDRKSIIAKAVKKAFYSEFRGEIFPKGRAYVKTCSVNIRDGQSELIHIDWDRDGVNKFDYFDDLGFDDATFVDTPSIIQFHSFTDMANTLFDVSNSRSGFTVPLHIKDLSTKIKESIYTYNLFDDFYHINHNLSNTYKGKLYYDKDSSEFLLDRGNYKINSSNVASGIKSLGIFDILVQSGHASHNSLLILDEPEINLHPKWQVEYARNIIELIKLGANIIVTTHSPYMLEALKGFCNKFYLEHNFYLAKRNEDSSELINITNRIEDAIHELSIPLFQLNEELYDDF